MPWPEHTAAASDTFSLPGYKHHSVIVLMYQNKPTEYISTYADLTKFRFTNPSGVPPRLHSTRASPKPINPVTGFLLKIYSR